VVGLYALRWCYKRQLLLHLANATSSTRQCYRKSREKCWRSKTWAMLSNITGTLPPTLYLQQEIWSQTRRPVPVFLRMRRARSIGQHEYVFLKTGLKFTKTDAFQQRSKLSINTFIQAENVLVDVTFSLFSNNRFNYWKTKPARANHGPRYKMTICEHGALSLWKLPMINNIRTFYRDFRAPLSTPGPGYFAPPPLAGLVERAFFCLKSVPRENRGT
jgi:hypothetical protein